LLDNGENKITWYENNKTVGRIEKMEIEESLKTVFELRHTLEHVMFKDFHAIYDYKDGMNQTHMISLMALYISGPLTMTNLSKKLNIEKGSFTPVANKLIKFGYVKKERNEIDKRVYQLSLTKRGNEIAKDYGKSHVRYVSELLSKLDEEKKEQFFNAVRSATEILLMLSGDINKIFPVE
jgi:DNA-binding MarR family transcriptional regulator